MNPIKAKLICLLQNAHAGERAAAFAYKGHGASVSNSQEIADLKKIENEEWDHRNRLGKMLIELGSGPRSNREFLMALVGRTISFLCLCSRFINPFNFGWFMSMYGAGKLERGNIVEYEVAARYALDCGYPQFVESLLDMAEIEWDHELYFRSKSEASPWSNYFTVWSEPPSRDSIRQSFLEYSKRKKENF